MASVDIESVRERTVEANGTVSVLIVSYNTRSLTLACLRSLQRARHPVGATLEIVVVDNASADGSADAVAAEFPDVTLIRSESNLGFAAAVNLASRSAVGDHLLLFNPDAELDGECLTQLLSAARSDPAAGLWGGRIARQDGTTDAATARRLPSLLQLIASTTGVAAVLRRLGVDIERAPGIADAVRPTAVDMLSGVLLMADTTAWGRLGGFNTRYFMYGEDVDLSRRAAGLGYHPTLVPQALAVHDAGASSTSTRRAQLKLAGRATYIDEQWSPLRRRAGLVLLQLGVLTRRLARRGDIDWSQVWANRALWRSGYDLDPDKRRHQLSALGITGVASSGQVQL